MCPFGTNGGAPIRAESQGLSVDISHGSVRRVVGPL
jgi:hypothetical protein